MSKHSISHQDLCMTAILSVKNLTISINGKDLVRNNNFDLYPGKTTALVGESGSGKSISAQSILGLLTETMNISGDINYRGQNLIESPEKHMQSLRGKKIAMIFQEPMTALNPLHTVEKQIQECLTKKHLSKSETKTAVIKLLQKVHIQEPESKLKAYPHQLSGGQRQRIMIAMALANKPEILIADEPTTALDVTVQKEILELLSHLQQQDNLAVLLISHDIHIVRAYSDFIAVMKDGQLLESNQTEPLFARAEHDYTKSLINELDIPSPKAAGNEEILNAKGINCYYKLAKTKFFQQEYFHALKDISLTLSEAEILGIIGESGSGKTTLANVLLKLIPAQGHYTLQQDDVMHLSNKAFRPYRQALQVVFQDPFASLSPRMTITAIISEGYREMLKQQGKTIKPEALEERVKWALDRVSLNHDVMHRYPHEFSGGQRQRIAIARAIIMQPRCIILDEPTSALDRNIQKQILDLIVELQQSLNISFILISHDLYLVRDLSHNVIILQAGKMIESGITQEVFQNPQHEYTQQLLSAYPDPSELNSKSIETL